VAEQRPSLLTALRHRRFRLLWAGAAASLLGDGVYLVALAWQAYTISPNPSGLALLGVCATVPQLLALLASGVVSDRYDRRVVLIVADVVRFVVVGAVAVLVLRGQVTMTHLAVLSVVYGLGAGIAAPAFDALVPELVPRDDLEQANALEQFLRPAMLRLAGPAAGGVLIAVNGAGTAFALDALTFLVSAGCLVAMGSVGRPTSTDDEPSLVREALAGLDYVRRRVWLWGTFGAATVSYLLFIGPTEVLLPPAPAIAALPIPAEVLPPLPALAPPLAAPPAADPPLLAFRLPETPPLPMVPTFKVPVVIVVPPVKVLAPERAQVPAPVFVRKVWPVPLSASAPARVLLPMFVPVRFKVRAVLAPLIVDVPPKVMAPLPEASKVPPLIPRV